MKMPAKTRFLPGIAKSLLKEGYQTSYIYGGDINFTNMRSYLVSTGFERLYWKDDYSLKEQNTSKWGVRDDITFGTVAAQIADYTAKGQPFVIGYSTLSSHEPWDVPLKKLNDEVDNAFYYLDQCIGNFVDSLRQTPAWTNLLIVLLPDHGIPYHGLTLADLEFSHIPMVWVGGAVKQARSVGRYCNQTDLAATLLGQMGIAHDDFRFSRDVMSSRYTKPFAVCTFNNGFVIADSASYGFLDLTSDLTIAGKPDGQQLINRGKALLQAAAGDLKELNSVSTTNDTNYHADYK
jgi:phosphoglycerol transferase MdoB-like AlkP superfamily enzyme